jgi:hypothetical protein
MCSRARSRARDRSLVVVGSSDWRCTKFFSRYHEIFARAYARVAREEGEISLTRHQGLKIRSNFASVVVDFLKISTVHIKIGTVLTKITRRIFKHCTAPEPNFFCGKIIKHA